MVRRTGGWVVCWLMLGAVLFSTPVSAQVPSDSEPQPVAARELADLPLVQVPATGRSEVYAVLVSGDGGWAPLPRQVAQVLSGAGIPVIGLNALKYFWTRRTPEGAAQDLQRILRFAIPATGRRDVVLVGYSRGADVLPFMVSRLPEDLRQRVKLVALLGPGETVDFQFHLADWWSNAHRRTDLPILPEVTRVLPAYHVLCVYGEGDSDTVCPQLPSAGANAAEVVRVKGSHHFDGAYAELGQIILHSVARPGA